MVVVSCGSGGGGAPRRDLWGWWVHNNGVVIVARHGGSGMELRIVPQFTSRKTSQRNGVSERLNRNLLTMVISMISLTVIVLLMLWFKECRLSLNTLNTDHLNLLKGHRIRFGKGRNSTCLFLKFRDAIHM